MRIATYDSPIGPLGLGWDDQNRVNRLSFAPLRPDGGEPGEIPNAVRAGLDAYFAGERQALARVPWAVEGEGFEARVWRLLADIPAGATWTYGEIARRAGEPGGAQAAGRALNRNPVALVLPCHRVVGADGSLTGFGGGLERKRWLLQHEGALLL